MKLLFRLACVTLIAGFSACKKNQGPELFDQPVDVPLVPEMASKFANIPYTFADGAAFEARFAGAPLKLTLTSGTTFRAEGNGKVWEGTITYPTAQSVSPSAAPAAAFGAAGEAAPALATNILVFSNTVFWFGNPNPAQNPVPGVGFNTVGFTFTSRTDAAFRLDNVVSEFKNTPPNFTFATCVLGTSPVVGPYGTTIGTYNRAC